MSRIVDRKAQKRLLHKGRLMRSLLMLLVFLMVGSSVIRLPGMPHASAEGLQNNEQSVQKQLDSLLPPVGSALVEAGQGKLAEATEDVAEFRQLWDAASTLVPEQNADQVATTASVVVEALSKAEQALSGNDSDAAKKALADLARATNQYIEAFQGAEESSDAGRKAAERLLPDARKSLSAMEQGDWTQAEHAYKRIVTAWKGTEAPIRQDHFGVYSQLEKDISLVRISMQAEPRKEEQATERMQELVTLLTDYSAGTLKEGEVEDTSASSGVSSLSDLLKLLEQIEQQIQAGDTTSAATGLEQFIVAWPLVEGQVQISSPASYTAIENEMAEASGYVVSNPPNTAKATEVVTRMINRLEPLTATTSYTAWDAALILLREGLEAILVLAALLAYAKKSGETAARRWIWAGAGSGLLLSAALAVVLSLTLAVASSGSTREMIEGYTGLAAVVLMLTVGHWMHSKSNTRSWNSYVQRQVGGALARGSLWSLFAVAGLAILREGAETAIFYIGMAPAIDTSQMLIGMGAALLILIVLAVAIIQFSVRLPVRWFFLTATLLIYYLVFRFLGESIHSLQVSAALGAHVVPSLPTIGWLGMYPTWETFIPQLVVLVFMIFNLIRTEVSSAKGASKASV
ncbi:MULTISPECIES: FTR1 family iron permease [unclassified Paenibacillus]|uniref:FTR1 family iron permease n=1 Tax=unclassified Paenibacillus TaxID=185978 RepID=UPI0009C6010E|nr:MULTISPECIES: FTR1 family protein [unclassified Paenibacillus]SLK06197.1 high-affinity iron transporter [Paenibacillus sp. RU5A]SOC70446.1 high-affinity iron transporter [Paenibacillus sp. RU26A]SOC72609.1 high-affinity iron transporter [Paenibacillus sp. RU5M]